MRYADARGLFCPGDLVFFWHLDDWKSRLIHWWTGGPTHVGTVWCIADRVLMVEATLLHGIRVFPLSEAGPFVAYHMGATWTDAAEDIAKGNLTDDYSQVLAVLSGIGISVNTTDHWQCAKLARYLVSACRYTSSRAIPELFVCPETLAGLEQWAKRFAQVRIEVEA